MPLQLLSQPTDTARTNSPSLLATPAPKHSIPIICLVAATPLEANNSSVAPWSEQQPPTTLADKASSSDAAPRKRLVPKKSKLGILPSCERDLADVRAARAAHLLPIFGTEPVPETLTFHDTRDIHGGFYVNRFVDHHAFKIAS